MTILISELLNVSTGVSIGGSGGITWKVTSLNTSTIPGNGYIVNTVSGEISLTLPEDPLAGDQIGVTDYNDNFGTNKCIILRNGKNIMGLQEDFICDVDRTSIMLVYADATQGWKILYGV